MGTKMAQEAQNTNPFPQEEGEKLTVVFSFKYKVGGNVEIEVSAPNLKSQAKTVVPDISYEIPAMARRLVKLEDIIGYLERDVDTEPVIKEMYFVVARLLLALMEY